MSPQKKQVSRSGQYALAAALSFARAHTPLLCVLVHGGALQLGSLLKDCSSIIDAFFPGEQLCGLVQVQDTATEHADGACRRVVPTGRADGACRRSMPIETCQRSVPTEHADRAC